MTPKRTLSGLIHSLKRGTEIFSIFGQIEHVAAEWMLAHHQEQCRKIPLEDFPDRASCPSIWVNSDGKPALYALQIPKKLVPIYDRLVQNLRS